MVSVERMKLGSQGLDVSKQGLGCMGMSAFYGPPKPEEDKIKLIHHAVESGIRFLDTSDVYGPFTNEILLGKVSNKDHVAVGRIRTDLSQDGNHGLDIFVSGDQIRKGVAPNAIQIAEKLL